MAHPIRAYFITPSTPNKHTQIARLHQTDIPLQIITIPPVPPVKIERRRSPLQDFDCQSLSSHGDDLRRDWVSLHRRTCPSSWSLYLASLASTRTIQGSPRNRRISWVVGSCSIRRSSMSRGCHCHGKSDCHCHPQSEQHPHPHSHNTPSSPTFPFPSLFSQKGALVSYPPPLDLPIKKQPVQGMKLDRSSRCLLVQLFCSFCDVPGARSKGHMAGWRKSRSARPSACWMKGARSGFAWMRVVYGRCRGI